MKYSVPLYLAAAATIFQPLPALAAQAVGAQPVSVLPLDQMCRATGTLDLDFGSVGNSLARKAPRRPLARPLGSEFAPFTEALLTYSRYSNILAMSGFDAVFDDEKGALAAADRLASQARQRGWFATMEPDKSDEVYQYSFSTTQEPSDPPTLDETTLSISTIGNMLSVGCDNAAASARHFDEAIGKMPVGMARPQYADYAVSAIALNPADCVDAAKRKAFQDRLEAEGPAGFSSDWGRVTYEEDLANWKIMRLTSSGKIDHDTITDKIIGLLDGPEAQENLEGAIDMLGDLGDDLENIAPDDEAGMCRAMHKMLQRTMSATKPMANATGDAVTLQWRETHALLDREAVRLGVVFQD
jgi:hypothetical protein